MPRTPLRGWLWLMLVAAGCSHGPTFPKPGELSCLIPRSKNFRQQPTAAKHPKLNPWMDELPPKLRNHLAAFKVGKIGGEAAKLQVTGLTSVKLADLLKKHGFRHSRIPLKTHPNDRRYRLKTGGTTTATPNAEEMLPMDIFDHPDGSLIRIKAWGIPDETGASFQPNPHVTKSIVWDASDECWLGFFDCHLNTSWANEAFKLTDDGEPMPKSISPTDGFRQNVGEELIKDTMDRIHIPLPSSYRHCDVRP